MDHDQKWEIAKDNDMLWNTRANHRLAREILNNQDPTLQIPRYAFREILEETMQRVNPDEEFKFNSQACDALQLASEDFTIKFLKDSGL